MIQQFHLWMFYLKHRIYQDFKEIHALPCLLQHDSQYQRGGNNLNVHQEMNE